MDSHHPQPTARLALPLAIGALVLMLYTSSLDNPFMASDHATIVNNPDITGQTVPSQVWLHGSLAGKPSGQTAYRPVTVLSYYINARITSLSPVGFRLVNMGLLALLGWLLGVWLRWYTLHKTARWLATALFVAHPIHAETINHIAGRSDLLAMIGIVGFLHIHRWTLEMIRKDLDHQTPWETVAVVTSVVVLALLLTATIAFGSAATGLVLIPLAVIQASLSNPHTRNKKPLLTAWQRRTVHVCTAICLGLPAWFFYSGTRFTTDILRFHWDAAPSAGIADITTNPLFNVDMAQRYPVSISLAWFYAKQLVWPALTYNHAPAHLPTWLSASTFLGGMILILMLAGLAVQLYRRHWLSMALVLALGQYLIIANPWRPLPIYASNLWTMPFTLAMVMWLARVIDKRMGKSFRRRALAVVPCGIALIVMTLGVLNVNRTWFSTPRLMAYDLSQQPRNAIAMFNYGQARLEKGHFSVAADWFERAISVQPHSIQARHQLALARYMTGQFDRAAEEYKQILHLDTNNLRAHIQLAVLSIGNQDLENAQYHIASAKKIAATNADVLYNEARITALAGNTLKAKTRYEALLRIYPNHASGRSEYEKLLQGLTHTPR